MKPPNMVDVTVMKPATETDVEHHQMKGEAATVEAERGLRMQVVSNSKGHQELNLQGRGLRQVPVQVYHMGSLHVLRLAQNHIDHLAMMISYLRSLRVLDMRENLLTKLPETLVNCRHLSRLDMSHNRLTGLPRTLGGLRELRHLGLAGNLMEQLPQEVGQLQALRVLNLHGNRLWHLPPSLEGLRHLSRLDLGDNMLDSVPLVVTRITSLKALDLSRNRLNALPVDIDKLRGLVELNLSHNKFLAVTSLLTSLTSLKYLSLASNGLKFLPSQMERLQNLEVLHLQVNSLKTIPALPISLKYYNVSRNRLEALTLERMRNLVSLTATHNQLSSAPQGLYKLRHLKFLYLDNNRLEELSSDLALLTELRVLTLTNNDLRRLPHRALLRLNKLASFNIKGNPRLLRGGGKGVGGHKGNGNTGATLTKPEGTEDRQGSAEEMKLKTKHGKSEASSKSKMVYGNGREKDDIQGGQFNSSTHTMRSNKPPLSFHRDQSAPKRNTPLQVQNATFPRSKSGNPVMTDDDTKQKHSGEAKPSKRFSSFRSLKDIFFGRKKNKNLQGSAEYEMRSSGINFDTRTALKPSDSVHLPLNYHVDDIDYDERSNRKWTQRSMYNNRSYSRHPSPRNSSAESFHRNQNNARSYQDIMRYGGGYHAEDWHRNGYTTTGSIANQGSVSHLNTMLPGYHYRAPDLRGNNSLQRARFTQGGSLRGKWPERYREFHSDYSPRNTMPLKKPYYFKSWVGQDGVFYHGQGPPESFPSGLSGQPSREHSIREAYASFATETPYSRRASPDSKAVYFPELDYTSASEELGHGYPMRSYKSDPTLYNERSNMPYDYYTSSRESQLDNRQEFSSEESVWNQQENEEETAVKQIHTSNSDNRVSHNWRNASPMSGRSLEREYPGLKRSNSLNFLHPEDPDTIQRSSRSSLTPSRVTDYVDCQDTNVSVSSHRNPTVASYGISNKGHFSQFDNILSTATIPSQTDQRATLGSPRLTPVALQHGHFLMKKKPTDHVTRTRSLDSILDYSPQNNNNNNNPTTGPRLDHQTTVREPHSELDLQQQQAGYPSDLSSAPSRENRVSHTDFSLLGVCNHVESMLNKNALQSGIYPKNRHGYSPTGQTTSLKQSIQDVPYDVDMNRAVRASLLQYSQPQTFTLTRQGGQFVSSGRHEVLVDVPALAVRRNLHMTMQLLTISPELLSQARQVNHFVSNILSLGPLVYFYTDRPQVSLNSPATITLPAPIAIKGGHLMVLSVRKDNSCLPVSSGYRSGHTAATMTTWHFSGKIAVITRAKCKYKACKSMEQLLQCIGATQA